MYAYYLMTKRVKKSLAKGLIFTERRFCSLVGTILQDLCSPNERFANGWTWSIELGVHRTEILQFGEHFSARFMLTGWKICEQVDMKHRARCSPNGDFAVW